MTQQGIEVFLAVARLGSVSAAAQALYITQPAVSRHLRALEEDLGCPLVVRGRGQRRVELTGRGRDLANVLRLLTSTPADLLCKVGTKGCVAQGADADLLVLTESLDIDGLFARGKTALWQGKVLMKGKFE